MVMPDSVSDAAQWQNEYRELLKGKLNNSLLFNQL